MSATPIVPGRAYRVRHNGATYTVFARNPVDALCIVLEAV